MELDDQNDPFAEERANAARGVLIAFGFAACFWIGVLFVLHCYGVIR